MLLRPKLQKAHQTHIAVKCACDHYLALLSLYLSSFLFCLSFPKTLPVLALSIIGSSVYFFLLHVLSPCHCLSVCPSLKLKDIQTTAGHAMTSPSPECVFPLR